MRTPEKRTPKDRGENFNRHEPLTGIILSFLLFSIGGVFGSGAVVDGARR